MTVYIHACSLVLFATNTLANREDRPDPDSILHLYMRDDVYAVIILNIHIT